jgi:glycosyltransferase involved in cell wall biosynthesis
MLTPCQPSRILMTTDTVGGVWTYALELAAGLAAAQVEVILATMGAPLSSAQRAQARRLQNVYICESSYRLEWMDDPWEDVAEAGLWLQSLEARYEPDIVHVNGYAHGTLQWMNPVVMVGHSCVLSWFDAVKGHAAPADWRHYEREVRRGLQAADHVVAPTQAMLEALLRHYGPLPRCSVIANGRDTQAFSGARKEPFILSAGRLWDEAKNVRLLCEVAPALEWPVRVAGAQTAPDAAAVDLPNVQCLGVLGASELAALYGRAAIYALPARYEPFGLSALEAALSECALVLSDIPSLREVWQDAAMYLPAGDAATWRAALQFLISDPAYAAERGAAARRRALEFSRERFAAGYLDLYTRLLDTSRRVAREPAIAA